MPLAAALLMAWRWPCLWLDFGLTLVLKLVLTPVLTSHGSLKLNRGLAACQLFFHSSIMSSVERFISAMKALICFLK